MMTPGCSSVEEVLDHLPDPTAIVRDGKVVYANAALLSLLDHSWSGLCEAPLTRFIDDEGGGALAAGLSAVAAGDSPGLSGEHRFLRADGASVLCEVKLAPISHHGRAALLIARDIAPGAVVRAEFLQVQRMASIGMLSAAVSHELNNPLAYVLANLSVILRRLPELEQALQTSALAAPAGKAPEAVRQVGDLREALREAQDGAERMQRTLTDLKRFARPDLRTPLEPVDARAVLETAINVTWNEIRHRAYVVRHFDDVPCVRADATSLAQVFVGLLGHIARQIPEGHAAEQTLVITTTSVDPHVVVAMRHGGRCVDEGVLKGLFDPFVAGSQLGGSGGMELAVCNTIVKTFGGAISVERDREETVFRVTLPCADEPQIQVTPESRPPSPTPPLTDLRVLIIDDEMLVARALRRILRWRCGIGHVEIATHGEDGINRLLGDNYDLVFCDLLMPDVTGMDVHERVVRDRPGAVGRFVFMSGSPFTPRARSFVDALRTPYIPKPFDEEEVDLLVRQVGSSPNTTAAPGGAAPGLHAT